MSAVPGSPKAPLDRSSTKFEEHKEPPTNKTLTQSHTEPQLAYSFLQGGPQVSYPFVYTNVDSPKMPHKVGLRNELNTEGYQSHKNLLVVYVKFTESWIESICIEDAKRMTCGELKHEVIRLYGQGLHARSQEDGLPVRKKVIVNLKTIRNMRGLDMWLSQPERPLDKLKSGDVLEPLFARKPHPPHSSPLQASSPTKATPGSAFKISKSSSASEKEDSPKSTKVPPQPLTLSAAQGNRPRLCDEGDREGPHHPDQEDPPGLPGAQHHVAPQLSLFGQDLLRVPVGRPSWLTLSSTTCTW